MEISFQRLARLSAQSLEEALLGGDSKKARELCSVLKDLSAMDRDYGQRHDKGMLVQFSSDAGKAAE